MTTPSPAFNPLVTTVFDGAFVTSANGFTQGTAMPDPSVVFARTRGILATAETSLMYGGCVVYANIPSPSPTTPLSSLGPTVGRATGATGSFAAAGISVFDGAYGMLNSPQSPVPSAQSGQQVLWYPFGSRARIAVACDPILVDLFGDPLGSQVAWDYVNEILIPYTGAITASSGTYNSTTGLVTLTLASAANLSPGDSVTVSGATAGSGSYAAINGTYTAAAGTTGSTVTYFIATGLTMTINTASVTTGPAFPCSVLEVSASGNQTVNYTLGGNAVTWNFNGAAALIRI